MRGHQLTQSSQGQDILSAWHEGVADAARSPELIREIGGREREILPRFAEHYERLRALPRRMRRAMQRKWKKTLAGVALLMALSGAPAMAATINVGVGGCTLVDAITSANTDTATGGCTAGSGADTIVLPANSTQTLTAINNTTYGANGLPVITSEITIQGNGNTITRSSADAFRIFAVSSSGNLTLQNTTVSGGAASSGSFPSNSGGGVFNYGTVTLTNSTVSGNSAYITGGVFNYSGTMTLTNSTVSGNSANLSGGGVANSGIMTLINSTVSGNSATNNVGGVYNGGTMTLTNSTVSGNSANGKGGGVVNYFGTMTLTNSTVSGNSATDNYGGVVNLFGTMTLTNSTVSGNSTNRNGGGVVNGGNVYNGATMTLSRTLISGNTGGSSLEVYNLDTLNANDFNLFGHDGNSGTYGFTPGATDIVPTVALSAILNTTLANNGGPTETLALVSGSPAIDAIPLANCPLPATDQRGVTRPQDGDNNGTALCDIGAFEATPPALTCNGKPVTSGCTVNGVANQLCKGTSGNDTILGTNGDDVIVGLGGNDTINAGNGNDTVCGGDGNDVISGGNGIDKLFGDAGNDTLSGDNGNDALNGGADTDSCNGGNGADTGASCESSTSIP